MISQSFIQELLNRVDIVDVIDRHLPLRKAGTNYAACCPFHSEKTPSFTVSPTKQFYHCFGCGAHGNAIGFLMEYNAMHFVEAVNDLAGRIGMQVPKSEPTVQVQGEEHFQMRSSGGLLEVMETAARFYRKQLRHSSRAIAYLKQRGLTGEAALHFGIGYASPEWRNLAGAFPDYAEAMRKDLLVQAGLVIEGDEGNSYDRFRDRIMFPILNLKGTIVGFGGRILDQGEPKYLNSPETPLFQKGRELYNLFAARKAIRDAGKVVVVEGYMDVIALSQHGIEYSVAALGTAVTPFHIQKLLRQTDNVVFCFDADAAGRKAARRTLENSLAQLVDGKNVSFLFLPEAQDPDSYIRQFGKDAFEGLLKQALPLSVFLFKELSAPVDLKISEGRVKLVQDVKPLLAQVSAPGLRLMLLKRLGEISGFQQEELENILKMKRLPVAAVQKRTPRPRPASPCFWLIQILLYDVGYIRKLDRELLAQEHENPEEMAALTALVEFIDTHPDVGTNAAMSLAIAYFKDSPYRALLEQAGSRTLAWDDEIDLEAEFSGAMTRLWEAKHKQRMTVLQNKPLNTLTAEERQELQRMGFIGNRTYIAIES